MAGDWTESDVGDQTGRTFLITGANSGIGLEAARVLVACGAHVVMACRNRAKAEAAQEEIAAPGTSGSTEILDVDLADLDSVASAAGRFVADHDRLDVLVNNAGLMWTPRRSTAQGFELQFGVNHLAHFALTGRLLSTLMATPASRVVTISSQGHRAGRINFDDLNAEKRYSPYTAYFQSKLANLLFTRELARRLDAAGSVTIAAAAHPGTSETHLGYDNPGGLLGPIVAWGRPLFDRFWSQSAQMGALPTLRAATDADVTNGDYFGPDGFFEQRGHPVKVGMSGRASDDASARRLWQISIELTGVDYPV